MPLVKISYKEIQEKINAGQNGDPAKFYEVEHILGPLLNHHPDDWVVMAYLAAVYLNTERHGLAIQLLQRAHTLKPDSIEVMSNLGIGYRKEHMHAQAELWFRRALEVKPDEPDIHNNIGVLYVNEGNPLAGIPHLKKALKLDPEHATAHWNLGLCYLELEEFEKGFPEYAWGQASRQRMNKDFGNAVWWDGQPHLDSSIVIYGEQGIGDEIMFSSILPEVIPMFKRVIFDCHPRLINLMKRAFPNVICYPTRKDIAEPVYWLDDEKPEYKLSIGNLGRFFRKKQSDFPKKPYLLPDRERVERFKALIKESGPAPYLGIGWVGGHQTTRKDLRSIPLSQWKPLIEEAATVISLQYTDRSDEIKEAGFDIKAFPEIFEASRYEKWHLKKGDEVLATFDNKDTAKQYRAQVEGAVIEHETGPAYDYDDTAAFVVALHELGGNIVTVNTSLVHLCGALGVPLITLTPDKPAWRYGLKRHDMVWYSTIRQVRQHGDWAKAINTVKALITEKGKLCQSA